MKPSVSKRLMLAAALALPWTVHAESARKSAGPAYEEDYEDANVQSAGGIIKFGETISVLEGEQVDGPVVAIGGSVKVDGAVNGPVVSIGGSTELGPHSEVNGPAVSIGGKTLRSTGSRIDGPIVDTPGAHFFGGLAGLAAYAAAASLSLLAVAKFSASLGWIVIALVLWLLFPRQLKATRDAMEKRLGTCVLTGFLAWPCLAVIAVTLGISIIGIPLIPPLLLITASSYVWGFAALGYLAGTRIAKDRWDSPAVSVTIGMLVLKALQWLPVLSFVVAAAAAIVGVGAAVVSRFGWARAED